MDFALAASHPKECDERNFLPLQIEYIDSQLIGIGIRLVQTDRLDGSSARGSKRFQKVALTPGGAFGTCPNHVRKCPVLSTISVSRPSLTGDLPRGRVDGRGIVDEFDFMAFLV
jgi:hypothetical protein